MKEITVLLALLACMYTSYAQDSLGKKKAIDKKKAVADSIDKKTPIEYIQGKTASKERTNLISNEAFDKMIIRDITYAIFGETTPTTGIKVDVSKPDATIGGVFTFKNKPAILLGVDFKGGATDKNFNIFKGSGTFNTAFEIRPSLHIILNRNFAFYREDDLGKKLIRNQNDEAKALWDIQRDTFLMRAELYAHYSKKVGAQPKAGDLLSPNDTLTLRRLNILRGLIKEYAGKEPLGVDTINWRGLLDTLVPADSIGNYKLDIYNKYKMYLKKQEQIEDAYYNKEIENAEPAWTWKGYQWLTFSPFGRTEKINQYHDKIDGRDTSYFKSEFKFYGGLGLFYNCMAVKPDKVAFYFKTGANLSYANNIANLTAYTYETTDSFFRYGKSATAKTKSGSAYNHTDIKNGFLGQLLTEFYILPLKSFIPGFFLSTNLNFSKIYNLPTVKERGNDVMQFGIEMGPVFNINSREKDKEKSILSIAAYVRFDDVTDKRRTNLATATKPENVESKDDYLKRFISFGVKVGIPITLPQRKN